MTDPALPMIGTNMVNVVDTRYMFMRMGTKREARWTRSHFESLGLACAGDWSPYARSNTTLPTMGKRTQIMQKKEDLRRAMVMHKRKKVHTALLTSK